MLNIPFIQIDESRCVRCGTCIRECFPKLLTTGEKMLPTFIPGGAEHCFRCQHCLAVCPRGAFSWNGLNPADSHRQGKLPTSEEMANLLRMRRSVRAYRQEDVEPEMFQILRENMRFSPTGCNDHRLFFAYSETRTVTDSFRETARKKVLEMIESQTLPAKIQHFVALKPALESGADIFFRNAPHFVAVAVPPEAKDAHIDPYIAVAQFELLAVSLGLGTCWGGMITDLFHSDTEFCARLEIPKTHELKIVLLFGYPSVTYARATQPEACPYVTLKNINETLTIQSQSKVFEGDV